MNRVTIWVKVSLISMLYRKALRISTAERQAVGVGQIVNHMSNDASKLWTLPQYLHVLWSGPFQICICLALLTTYLGWVPTLVRWEGERRALLGGGRPLGTLLVWQLSGRWLLSMVRSWHRLLCSSWAGG